jgi:MFS family permease
MTAAVPSAPGRPAVWWIVLLAAAGAFALTMGTRQTMGLFIGPINSATGLGLASISLAFAVGQLWWGLTQPFAGAAADRLGAGRPMLLGLAMVAIGTALVPFMQSTLGLTLAIGILAAGGAGLAGPAVLMSATTRLMPPERRGLATGIVNAGGSFGQFALAPVAAWLLATQGWQTALWVLAAMVLLALPAAWVLRGGQAPAVAAPSAAGSVTPPTPPAAHAAMATLGSGAALRAAFADRSFVLLTLGFFVCGFHVAFLATHLPGVVASCGLSPQWAGWALAVLGAFNIAGSLAMGWAVGRWRMKSLLTAVYTARALAVLIFLVVPKTGPVLLIFAAVMGVTFLSTVPPTAGLVAKFFGVRHMAMLFGITMLSHQIGGFLGAWLGGVLFEATGGYTVLWLIDAGLAIGAALLHLPIREAPVVRRPAPAPA